MGNIICVSELVIKARPGWLLWICNPVACFLTGGRANKVELLDNNGMN